MIRRNQILGAILVVQLIVSVLIFVLPGRASTTVDKPLLESYKAADVTQIALRDKDGGQLQLAKKEAGWVLPASDDFPVEASKVSAFLDKLATVQTTRLIATTPASHARLQVADDDFTRRVDLTAGSATSRTLFIGSQSSNATHVRVAGSDSVYLTDKLTSFDANIEAANWINTQYYTLTQDNLIKVSIGNISGTLTFERTPMNTWKLDQLAAGQNFDVEKFTSLLGRLANVSMTKPLGKTARPEYGLDKPGAMVTFTLKGDELSAAPIDLVVGKKDATADAYAIKISTSPYVVQVNGFTVADLMTLTPTSFALAATTPPTTTQAPTANP